MAWWTSLFLHFDSGKVPGDEKKEANALVLLIRAIRKAFYENLIDTIHVALLFATYAYFFLSVAAFLFQNIFPRQILYVVDAFSEPYLGVLGIYVVVNEIRKRRGSVAHPHFASIFAGVWAAFLITSTLIVVLGDTYYFNDMYRTVVTNSLAALIIRVGAIVSKVP
ncbi:MAG: hypothetical protein Q7R91_02975 [bacterium]|nr:hypothetical protein [bacterium]